MHISHPAVCFPVKLVCATLCRPAVEPCAGTAGLPGAGGETLVNGTRALPRESCCLLPTLSRPPPATGEKPVAGAALERPAQQPNSGSGSRSSSSGGGEEKQQVAPGREQPGRKGLLTAGCSLSRLARGCVPASGPADNNNKVKPGASSQNWAPVKAGLWGLDLHPGLLCDIVKVSCHHCSG